MRRFHTRLERLNSFNKLKKRVVERDSNTREVEMPRIIHVPLRLAKHMYKEGKRYTPYDVNEIITKLYVDDVGSVPACWEPIATWCLLAQQGDEVCLDVAAITEPPPPIKYATP